MASISNGEPLSKRSRGCGIFHLDSLQSLDTDSQFRHSQGKDLFHVKKLEYAHVTPDRHLSSTPSYHESNDHLHKLVDISMKWLGLPPLLELTQRTTHIRPLTISTIPPTNSPLNILKAPVVNIDSMVKNRVEFASHIQVSLYNTFKTEAEDVRELMIKYEKWMYNSNTIHDSDTLKPPSSIVACKQSPDYRSIVIDVMSALVSQFFHAVPPGTLHLAVNILDRYIAKKVVSSNSSYTQSNEFGKILFDEIQMFSFPLHCLLVYPTKLLHAGLSALLIALKFDEGSSMNTSSYLSTIAPLISTWEKALSPNSYQTPAATLFKTSSPSPAHIALGGKRARTPSYIPIQLEEGDSFLSRVNTISPSHEKDSRYDDNTNIEIERIKSELVNCERDIVRILQWDIRAPTVHTFLTRYMVAGGFLPHHCLIAQCLCDRTLVEGTLLRYNPAMLAATVVRLVRQLHGLSPWTSTLTHYSNYEEGELLKCTHHIRGLLFKEQILRNRMNSPVVDNSQTGGQVDTAAYVPGQSVRCKYTDHTYQNLICLPLLSAPIISPR